MPISIQERIAQRTSLGPGGCLLWLGYAQYGYGYIRIDGKVRRAHRVAWELENGPIPSGLVIDHLCRVRNCVNTAHMRVVTNRTNVLAGEGLTAVHARKTHCVRGHNEWSRRRGRRSCKACDRAYPRKHKQVGDSCPGR